MYYVYYTYCFTEEKGFVGFTENANGNGINCESQRIKLLLEAKKKFGTENFATKVLFKTRNLNETKSKEIEFIQKLKTQSPNGYNVGHGHCEIINGKQKLSKEILQAQYQQLQKELAAMLETK